MISKLLNNDRGLTTIEYAMLTLVAAAIVGVLYVVISSGVVSDAFESIITDALSNRPG